jgi:ATP-dependent DNA helicase RecG
MMQFRLADFERDRGWIESVKNMAPAVMEDARATEALVRRWLGERVRYGDV